MKLTRITGVDFGNLTGLLTMDDGTSTWIFKGNIVSFSGFCQLTRLNRKQQLRLIMTYDIL